MGNFDLANRLINGSTGQGISDKDGKVFFRSVPAGSLFTAVDDEFDDIKSTVFVKPNEINTILLDYTTKCTVAIPVKVFYSDGKTPRKNVRVAWLNDDRAVPNREATTDANGSCSIEKCLPGKQIYNSVYTYTKEPVNVPIEIKQGMSEVVIVTKEPVPAGGTSWKAHCYVKHMQITPTGDVEVTCFMEI